MPLEPLAVIFRIDNASRFQASSSPIMVEGTPRQHFRKEIIPVGEFYKDSEDRGFNVTKDVIEHWRDTFRRMVDNGVEVTLPSTHGGVGDPDKNRGYARDMFIAENKQGGQSLFMDAEMIGQDAIDAAARSDVSINVEDKLIDCKKNEYELPITHVALCTDPVVTGMEGFVPIAASRKRKNAMDFKKLAKELGITGDLTDANANELILSAFKAQAKPVDEIKTVLSLSADVKPGDLAKTIGDKFKGLRDQLAKAKPSDEAPPSTEVMRLSRENQEMKMDAMVAESIITPATKASFVDLFLEDEPLSLSLSSKATGPTLSQVLKIVGDNDPVELSKHRSKAQVASLENPNNGGDAGKALIADAERRKKEAVAR